MTVGARYLVVRLRLIVLKGTARRASLLSQFLSSRFLASHMDGCCLHGGGWTVSPTRRFLLNQALVSILLTSVFGKLEDIFGNHSFPKLSGLKST